MLLSFLCFLWGSVGDWFSLKKKKNRHCPYWWLEVFAPIFSFISFMPSILVFEWFFVNGEREELNFILSSLNVPSVQYHLLKSLLCLWCMFWASLLSVCWLQMYDFMPRVSTLLYYVLVLMPVPCWIGELNLEIRCCDAFSFVLFAQDILFIAALFTIAKIWNPLRCSLMHEWMKK